MYQVTEEICVCLCVTDKRVAVRGSFKLTILSIHYTQKGSDPALPSCDTARQKPLGGTAGFTAGAAMCLLAA